LTARGRRRARPAGCVPASGRPRPVPDRRVPRPHRPLHGLGGVGRSRLLRSGGLTDAEPGREEEGVSVLELLGPRWYRMAVRQVRGPLTGTMRATADMAAHFPDARRILNFVTDRFLFPFRSHWFGAGGD